MAVGQSDDLREVHAFGPEKRKGLVREGVDSGPGPQPDVGAQSGEGQRLVGALAAGMAREAGAYDGFSRAGEGGRAGDDVEIDRADDPHERTGHP